jgi:hypothetical protein
MSVGYRTLIRCTENHVMHTASFGDLNEVFSSPSSLLSKILIKEKLSAILT